MALSPMLECKGSRSFLFNGLKKDKESDDVMIVEGAVYVKDHDAAVIQKIVIEAQAKNGLAEFLRVKKRRRYEGMWQEPFPLNPYIGIIRNVPPISSSMKIGTIEKMIRVMLAPVSLVV